MSSPEEEQADLARAFLREAWSHTPHLMVRYRPPRYMIRADILMNTAAFERLNGGRFVEFVERREVLSRAEGRCQRCGDLIKDRFHVDHIVSLQHGGDHSYLNTQALHPDCHAAKSAEEVEYARHSD